MNFIIRVVFLVTFFSASNAVAQRTGTLLPASAEVRGIDVREIYGKNLASEDQEKFALLVLDPSLSGGMSASTWIVNIVAVEDLKEARIQLNVCDAVGCKGKSAAALRLAGPLDQATHFTQLANLNGLIGRARIESEWTQKLTDASGKPTLTAGATFARPHFKFHKLPNLAVGTLDQSEYSANIGLGEKWVDHSARIEFRYQKAHKTNPSQNVCVPAPFGAEGTQTCSEMVVGEPGEEIRSLAVVDMRQTFGKAATVGLIITQDFRNSVTGFEIPISIIPDVKDTPAGGVRAGYRSDTKHITLTFFVGALKL